MAFSFAVQPQDYALRAQAGLSLDPSMSPDQVSGQAQQMLSAPPVQQTRAPMPQAGGSAPLADIPVSPTEAIFSWLAHGGSPAEAAQRARATKVQNMLAGIQLQQAQDRFKLSGGLSDRDRLDYLTDPAKFTESDAKNLEPQKAAANETVIFRGGPGQQGGSQFSAPGTYTAENGLILNSRTGPVGSYATPQAVAPGASLKGFEPGYTAGGSAGGGAGPGWSMYGAPVPAPGNPMAKVQAAANPPGKFDAAGFIRSFILPHEGGLNPHDMNGAPTKYGINQTANPGIDVAHLTADQAAQIYQEKYLPMSGAAGLTPALGAVHLDTSIINPTRAHQFLEQSGGDPVKYLALRQAWMDHMVQNNPAAAPYAKAWNQRNADLAKIISDSGAQPMTVTAGAGGGGAAPGMATRVADLAQGRQPRLLTPQEAAAAGFSPGAVVQLDAEGHASVAQAPEYGPEAKSSLRNHVLTSDEYKQAQASQAAYKAMIANAATMTGPGAYSMLDTFARAINPGAVARPTVIQTLEHSLGPLNGVEGGWDRVLGQGNLTPQVRQQIIDAVVPFAQAHWDQAKMLNDSNAELAKSHGFKAEDVTAPLDERPQRMIATPDGAVTEAQALAQARQAIKAGAPREKVIERLQSMRIRPAGL